MNSIKCQCGASEKNFTHLTQKDLPNGWDGDCCVTSIPPKATESEVASFIADNRELMNDLAQPRETKAERKAKARVAKAE